MTTIQAPQDTSHTTHDSYNSTFAITWDLGMVMVLIAEGGLFHSQFIDHSLSFMHCLVLGSSGLLIIWSEATTLHKAFVINFTLGIFFLLNSILGFLVGGRGHIKFGYGTNEVMIVKFASGFLELSTFDHILHFELAFFMLIEAYSWGRSSLDFPSNLKRDRNMP